MSDNSIFIGFDADNAGRQVGRAILSNDPEQLVAVSEKIQAGDNLFNTWCAKWKGRCLSTGGDQGLYVMPTEAAEEIEIVRKDYQFLTGYTVTVGVGKTMSDSGAALMVGKIRGKNQTVYFDEQVQKEYDIAQQNTENGTATGEAKKIGDAYMKKDEFKMQKEESPCPYCDDQEQEIPEDHCQYCHDKDVSDVADGGDHDDCPYCTEQDLAAEHDPDAEDHDENCPYCEDLDSDNEDAQANRDELMEDVTPDDREYQSSAGSQSSNGDTNNGGADFQTPPQDEEQQDEGQDEAAFNPHSEEGMKQVLEAIEQDGAQTSSKPVPEVDDANGLVGDEMEDNVSRPDDYETNVPGDMGLSEEDQPTQPDLTEVLKDGLDSHADNIKREKVVAMVSQALEGFKANKHILEKAKDQAPQLYESSLAMLKAMIEMAKMLGLSPEQAAPQTAKQPEAAPNSQEQDKPADPKLKGQLAKQ